MKSNTLVAQRISATTMVRAGLLITLSLVLKVMFELYIPLAGFPALRINFASVPIMVAGIICGPLVGFISGGVADLLNFMIKPGGTFFPGFVLSSALTGLIPGLVFTYMKQKKGYSITNGLFMIILSIGCVGVLVYEGILTAVNGELFYNGESLNWVYFALAILLIGAFILLPVIVAKKNKELEQIDKVIFAVSITQVVSSLILNTYFLSVMYGKGFMVFLPARILSNFFMIPLYAIAISVVLGIVKKMTKYN